MRMHACVCACVRVCARVCACSQAALGDGGRGMRSGHLWHRNFQVCFFAFQKLIKRTRGMNNRPLTGYDQIVSWSVFNTFVPMRH